MKGFDPLQMLTTVYIYIYIYRERERERERERVSCADCQLSSSSQQNIVCNLS